MSPAWKVEQPFRVAHNMPWTDLLDNPDTVVAVVGATDAPGKYGGVIYRNLKGKGFTVYAVNPNREFVDGDRAYPTLAALPERPHIIDLVVPAADGMAVATEAALLGLDRIWLQPGAEGPSLVKTLDDAGLEFLIGRCIMVEAPSHR